MIIDEEFIRRAHLRFKRGYYSYEELDRYTGNLAAWEPYLIAKTTIAEFEAEHGVDRVGWQEIKANLHTGDELRYYFIDYSKDGSLAPQQKGILAIRADRVIAVLHLWTLR